MTTFLGGFGMENLVEGEPQQQSVEKEKWNLAKVIGRDIFQGGQTIRGSHDFKQQDPKSIIRFNIGYSDYTSSISKKKDKINV